MTASKTPKMKAAPKPWRSGHCGLRNPQPLHRHCSVSYEGNPCVCDCHKPDWTWVDGRLVKADPEEESQVDAMLRIQADHEAAELADEGPPHACGSCGLLHRAPK